MTRGDPLDRRGPAGADDREGDDGPPGVGEWGGGASDDGPPGVGDRGGGASDDGPPGVGERGGGASDDAPPGTDGEVHVYTGGGKGKTTAAFGAALRAVGHGWQVHVVQFMKGDPYPAYGEVVAAEEIDGLTVEQHPTRHLVDPDAVEESDREAVADAMAASRAALTAHAGDAERTTGDADDGDVTTRAGAASDAGRAADARYDLVVLDEVNVACHFGLADPDDVAAMLAERRAPDAICTGRRAPDAVVAAADLVTRMAAVRHPRPEGPALEGIDR